MDKITIKNPIINAYKLDDGKLVINIYVNNKRFKSYELTQYQYNKLMNLNKLEGKE